MGKMCYYRTMSDPTSEDFTAPDPYGHGDEFAYPDYPDMRADFTIDQDYDSYTPEDHAVWHDLMRRQLAILPGRACREYLDAFTHMELSRDRIPRFEDYSDMLMRATGWQIVAVPGLIPNIHFFEHLANKRFPVTHWIRPRAQLDYIQEPDLFHDFQGHVPLLLNPVFAGYMEAYGKGGLKAMKASALSEISRLYWYTVEFGLIRNDEGLRIYGAGIVSSKTESIFALESASPNRIGFDLRRILKTDYRIDDFQESYFVIDSFEDLFAQTAEQDFLPIYDEIKHHPILKPWELANHDETIHRGTRDYVLNK